MRQRTWGRSDTAVALLTAALTLVAAALVVLLPEATPDQQRLPWWLLAVAFAVAEVTAVHVQVRRDSVSVSFGEIPLVLGLAFTMPIGYVLASVLGSTAVLILQSRLRGLKLVFNAALFMLEAALAQTVYLALVGDGGAASVQAGLASAAAIFATCLASAMAITAVIGLSTGRLDREPLVGAAVSILVGGAANGSLALLVVVLLIRQPSALVPLLVVLAAMIAVYRAYATLGRGHARLELIYRFTRGVAREVDSRLAASAVMAEARDVLQSDVAVLVLLDEDGQVEQHLVLSDAGSQPVARRERQGWWDAAAAESVIWPRGSAAAAVLQADGLDDAMAVPLQAAGRVLGVLAVAQRPAFLPTYTEEDVRLFQSLADHAAVALHNGGLVDQLRREVADREHQALHDSRTGLPNRRRFLERLTAELDGPGQAGVLVLDLVGFGEINDALGYETGDRLLVEVGRRLAALVGSEQVARLGNDEFAVLLDGCGSEQKARRSATQLLESVQVATQAGEFTLDVRATAGVACSPWHGTTAELLLRHADAAMSAAKQAGRPLGVYDLVTNQGSARRLQLAGDLRTALGRRELTVSFQPKTDASSGATVGAEALARWLHPELGPIGPDEFVPLAEHVGLIGDLTSFVLDTALDECAGWRRAGHEVGVAVNLSVRSLGEPDLPDRVAAALVRAGLPAQVLTLEITESAVMADLGHSLQILHSLRALGVRLSMDDFGTGHSSLAYLRELPVQEVKIDKSFVQGLLSHAADTAIVSAAVELGHALGLSVVAEGVEDDPTRLRLKDLRVDVLQGYLMSRPLPAPAFLAWLAADGAVTDPPASPVRATAGRRTA